MKDPKEKRVQLSHDGISLLLWQSFVVVNLMLIQSNLGYFKLYQLSKKKIPFDCIIVDEAQDHNEAAVDILLSQTCTRVSFSFSFSFLNDKSPVPFSILRMSLLLFPFKDLCWGSSSTDLSVSRLKRNLDEGSL